MPRTANKQMNARIIAAVVVLVLLLVFIIQNTEVAQVSFLFWSISMSRALLILFLLVIGAALGWFLHGYRARRRHR